jgi:hypothetical protein
MHAHKQHFVDTTHELVDQLFEAIAVADVEHPGVYCLRIYMCLGCSSITGAIAMPSALALHSTCPDCGTITQAISRVARPGQDPFAAPVLGTPRPGKRRARRGRR